MFLAQANKKNINSMETYSRFTHYFQIIYVYSHRKFSLSINRNKITISLWREMHQSRMIFRSFPQNKDLKIKPTGEKVQLHFVHFLLTQINENEFRIADQEIISCADLRLKI